MPEFALTTQDGVSLGRDALLGRVTIVDFMFTHCPFICPKLTATMGMMARELQGTPVRFLSISVDPEHDTPARLKEYATQREIDTMRWTLATGDRATVKKIVSESLMFNLEDEPQTPVHLPDGGTMSNISHPGHFVLVGPAGEVLGIYHVDQPDRVEELIKRARAASEKLTR
jgi:protein SCO1